MKAVDSQWMALALQLAERGLYTTSPNPRVGCVLVKADRIVGEGWHERAGEPHAEVHALNRAGEAVRGATAYVTLEPCSHHGRTAPCADALIAAGIKRVVVAMQDPNPLVAGQGLKKLRSAGIEVECGVMETAAYELNIGFFSRMTHGKPWVRSKMAASLDGRTALANGVSKWITSEQARHDVQVWRARSCAVLTGIGTVLADDPLMNVREIEVERQPWRVVLDSQLRLSPAAKILKNGKVLIYTACSDEKKRQALEASGAEMTVLRNTDGQVDLAGVLHDLAQRGMNEVLVEAGPTLNGALLKAGLVNQLVLYLSPQLLGNAARGLAELGELVDLQQGVRLQWQDVRHIGADLRIVAAITKEI